MDKFDEGVNAYHAWRSKKELGLINVEEPDCPYQYGTPEHESWEHGYYAADAAYYIR